MINTAPLKHYASLMRLEKPIGFFLLLWPALMAIWIAGKGQPPLSVVMIFVIGCGLMRSAGCVINDFADRGFDGLVARTRARPLPTQKIRPLHALGVFFALVFLAFLLVLLLNLETIFLSLIALFLAMLYPFMKRYTHFPQVVLGMAYGFSIPMSFMALTHEIPVEAFLLYAANLCWVLAYDTEYAMVDREDDLRIGIKSTAVFFGNYERFFIFVMQLSALGFWIGVGWFLQLRIFFYCCIALASCLFLYQQYLIKNRDPKLCFKAFLNNNTIGGILFLGIALNNFS